MNGKRPMLHRNKTAGGAFGRLNLLRAIFSSVDRDLVERPRHVAVDEMLDAAAAAWTAPRYAYGESESVSLAEPDAGGSTASIVF
jgi:hypothetical protein